MLYALLAAANGVLTVMSRMVNAALGRSVGSLPGSMVNHLVGALGAGVVVLFGWQARLEAWTSVPWIYFTGGCLGVLVVAASNYVVRAVGATLFAVLLLLGQILTSALIDHFGWMGEIQIAMTPMKLLGLALLFAGALLVLADGRRPVTPGTDAPAPEGSRRTHEASAGSAAS